jgi:hypothetical protein
MDRYDVYHLIGVGVGVILTALPNNLYGFLSIFGLVLLSLCIKEVLKIK